MAAPPTTAATARMAFWVTMGPAALSDSTGEGVASASVPEVVAEPVDWAPVSLGLSAVVASDPEAEAVAVAASPFSFSAPAVMVMGMMSCLYPLRAVVVAMDSVTPEMTSVASAEQKATSFLGSSLQPVLLSLKIC